MTTPMLGFMPHLILFRDIKHSNQAKYIHIIIHMDCAWIAAASHHHHPSFFSCFTPYSVSLPPFSSLIPGRWGPPGSPTSPDAPRARAALLGGRPGGMGRPGWGGIPGRLGWPAAPGWRPCWPCICCWKSHKNNEHKICTKLSSISTSFELILQIYQSFIVQKGLWTIYPCPLLDRYEYMCLQPF